MAGLYTDLIIYWSLDEVSTGASAVTRNDSHGTNHLTDNATVASGVGKVGNCADLEHSNAEYFSIAHNASLALSSDQAFTWAFWWFAETFTGLPARPIISKGGGGNAEYLVVYTTATNELALQITTTGANYSQVKTTYSGALAEWHFTIVWHDPVADKLCLRLDGGTVVEAAHAGGTFASTGALNIGRNTNTTSQRWDGLLDEIGFWKRVLTQQEQDFLYNSGAGRSYASLASFEAVASGALPTVTLQSPQATVIVSANAAGSIGMVLVSPLQASALITVIATGGLGTITVSPPQAVVQIITVASGLLPVIIISRIQGSAVVIGAPIDLNTYCERLEEAGECPTICSSCLGSNRLIMASAVDFAIKEWSFDFGMREFIDGEVPPPLPWNNVPVPGMPWMAQGPNPVVEVGYRHDNFVTLFQSDSLIWGKDAYSWTFQSIEIGLSTFEVENELEKVIHDAHYFQPWLFRAQAAGGDSARCLTWASIDEDDFGCTEEDNSAMPSYVLGSSNPVLWPTASGRFVSVRFWCGDAPGGSARCGPVAFTGMANETSMDSCR